ncbi:MAG: hypothetical protein ACE5G5_05065 [Candidatus Methylomirabilales bacterium]
MATVLALAACSQTEGPEAIAQSFTEQYYVNPDLAGAKALTYGLARHKIEKEEGLVQNVPQGKAAADREVSYRLHDVRQMGENKVFFVYDIVISVDRRVLRKRATIATGRVKEGWRVTNFQETDI